MFSAFHMVPAASGLCDIDRVFFTVAKSRIKNWEVHRKYTNNLRFSVIPIF